MSTKKGDNNIVKILEAAHARQTAENALKLEVYKAQVASVLKRQEQSAQIQEQSQASRETDRQKNMMENPQMFTPEQQYLRRRFQEENPLSALNIPEEGSVPAGQPVGMNMPQEEVVRDEKTKTFRAQPINEDRQADLVLEKVDQMLKEGKKPHPAIMMIADKMREAKLNREFKAQNSKGSVQNFNATTRARKEFIDRPEVKDYMIISPNIKSMDALLKAAIEQPDTNKIGFDQGLVTLFNKLTDPQSVVRESEYARTANDLSVVNRIIGAIDKAKNGGAGLTDDDRKALVLAAKIIANERGNQYNQTRKEYVELAKNYQFDPDLVTRGMQEFEPFDVDPPEGTATNPKTGEKMELRNGKWVPSKKAA